MSSDTYTELFKITYSGVVSDLDNHISELDGVERVSGSGQQGNVDGTLAYDITYNTYQTDQDHVANEIENIGGVTDVTFG